MDKKHCSGCSDNFYNQGNNSQSGECWQLESAKRIMRKVVHIDQVPPWNQKAEKLPDCYRKSRHVIVAADRIN